MAAAYVAERGVLNTGAGSGTTQAVTVASNCTAAATIILVFSARDTSTTGISVADSRGNTWTVDAGPVNTSNNLCFIASTRQNTGTLQSADIVTITFGTAPNDVRLCLLEEFSGLASASYVDVTTSNGAGSGTSYATGTTAATSQADELAVAVWTISDLVDPTRDGTYSDFTTPTQDNAGSEGFSKSQAAQFKILSATGTQSATVTSGATHSWQALIVTYKAAVVAAEKQSYYAYRRRATR